MGCGVYWQQIRELERAMGTMRRFGISELSDPFQQLSSLRGTLLKQVGFKFPRSATGLLKLIGLSPGTITLYHDVEAGWFTDGRQFPGGPPIIRYVDDVTAMALLWNMMTPELHDRLLTPDGYIGE